ncbi:hypothetical protein TTHERM_000129649 (macronuclear) [Tetrahymena thermophila SB210]|uniref:Uncharacterized protein n=1 Tax=Tetrahymena thermophila (strain SB210) TaxID=312017 RepID=W7XAF2_TETTS|nr:hypothetical protein TTHERM_000129649 [Tetrahymena thermophila SB210]EWS74307.1 hypothetical protein TTHERM_000129649 [Tetrahymena thermophila SB210]|eukprot:XP_012653128.1 hypothetical protein TTHERM_000129649 [Tetrahymena thermophila SB210]
MKFKIFIDKIIIKQSASYQFFLCQCVQLHLYCCMGYFLAKDFFSIIRLVVNVPFNAKTIVVTIVKPDPVVKISDSYHKLNYWREEERFLEYFSLNWLANENISAIMDDNSFPINLVKIHYDLIMVFVTKANRQVEVTTQMMGHTYLNSHRFDLKTAFHSYDLKNSQQFRVLPKNPKNFAYFDLQVHCFNQNDNCEFKNCNAKVEQQEAMNSNCDDPYPLNIGC